MILSKPLTLSGLGFGVGLYQRNSEPPLCPKHPGEAALPTTHTGEESFHFALPFVTDEVSWGQLG